MSKLIDADTLDSLRDLQSDDDPEFVKNYFTLFLDSMPELLRQMRLAVKSQNFKQLEMSAHALKSSSANSGVNGISKLSAELEKLGTSQSTESAVKMCDDLDILFIQLQDEVKNLPEFSLKKNL